MIEFLNSTGFQTLVAFIVGVFIFIRYRISKNDEFKNAAQLIVVEIQSAERKIKSIKKRLSDGVLESDVSIISSNSWPLFRHLFSRFLDRDEWDAIEEFYDKAQLLNSTIRYNDQMFRNDVEQIRINKQRAMADFAVATVNNIGQDSATDKGDVAEVFSMKVKVYDTLYMSKQGEMGYTPNRVIDDAKKYISNIPDIINSSALSKLKSLSKNRKGFTRNRIF